MKYSEEVGCCFSDLMLVRGYDFSAIYREISEVQAKLTERFNLNSGLSKLFKTAIDMQIMTDYKGRIDRLDAHIQSMLTLQSLLREKDLIMILTLQNLIRFCKDDIKDIEDGEKQYSPIQSDLCRQYQKKQDQFLREVLKKLEKLEEALEKEI